MIKLLRNIRKKNLNEGMNNHNNQARKTSKYLKYAIGEIFLVVVGILLALQINNWNQARIQKKQEIKIYKEIKSDLIFTLDDIQSDMSAQKRFMTNSYELLNHLIFKRPYSDQIERHMDSLDFDSQVYSKSSGFDALNSIGVDLLSNDSVRINITNLYQLTLKRLVDLGWRETPSESIKQLIGPFVLKHSAIDPNTDHKTIVKHDKNPIEAYSFKIRDYAALLNDHDFHERINLAIGRRAHIIRRHNQAIIRVQETIALIEEELNQLEK